MQFKILAQRPSRASLINDLGAGLTGALAGAPQAMAFAIIAGVSPVYGLYTAIVATLIGALLTSSVYMTIAPSNALALVVGATLIRFEDANPIERLITLTFMVGVVELTFGLLRLGNITRFVSNAVMTGFITGAGFLIILGQIAELSGHEQAEGQLLILRVIDLFSSPEHIDLPTLIIGLLALLLMELLHRSPIKNFASLIVIVSASGFIALMGWDSVQTVRDMADVPGGLPGLMLPNPDYMPELWSVALALAVLGLVQSAGISQNIPQPDGTLPKLSQDFIGQGAANLVGSFFQSMPAGGSLSRTAVNMSSGAKTRLANIFGALFTALILIALGGLIERVALTVLAAHLILAAASLIKLEHLRLVWQVGRSARVAMFSTLGATLVLPLEYSIYIGVAFSMGLYVYTSSSFILIRQLRPLNACDFQEIAPPAKLKSREPIILSVYGNLYFAAITTLESALPSPNEAEMPVVILRLKGNQYMGATGLQLLERYADQLEARGGKLILTGIGTRIAGQLQRTGRLARFGLENIYFENDVLLSSTRAALAAAESWLAEQAAHLDELVI